LDRTIVNLLSLLLGGAGIFAVLTEYSVPEMDKSYWGFNPFTVKAGVIKRTMTTLFIGLAVAAVLLQAAAEIIGDALPERRHTMPTYVGVFLIGVAVSAILVWVLAKLGRRLARRRWLPWVIRSQRKSLEIARDIIQNQGWRQEQLARKDSLADPAKYVDANLNFATRTVQRIERLLELDDEPKGNDLGSRAARLGAHFSA
jgi:hypothetical protein